MNRKDMIRLASDLPKGSAERRGLLSYLKEARTETFGKLYYFDDMDKGSVVMTTNVDLREGIPPGKTWAGGQVVGKVVDKAAEANSRAMTGWVKRASDEWAELTAGGRPTLRHNEEYTNLIIKDNTLFVESHFAFRDLLSHGLTVDDVQELIKNTVPYFGIHAVL